MVSSRKSVGGDETGIEKMKYKVGTGPEESEAAMSDGNTSVATDTLASFVGGAIVVPVLERP